MSRLAEGRTVLLLFLLALTLYFLVAALAYGRNSRIFPLAIGLPTAVLVGLSLAAVWRPGLLARAEVRLGVSPAADGPEPAAVATPPGRVLAMVGWLLLPVVGIALVGFGATTPVYVVLFGRLVGRVGWKGCLLAAAGSWGFVVGYFELFMQFRLFRGVLFGDALPLL
jgi:hypothetical protein